MVMITAWCYESSLILTETQWCFQMCPNMKIMGAAEDTSLVQSEAVNRHKDFYTVHCIHCVMYNGRKQMDPHQRIEIHAFILTFLKPAIKQWPLHEQALFRLTLTSKPGHLSPSSWQSPAGLAYPHPIPFSFPCS